MLPCSWPLSTQSWPQSSKKTWLAAIQASSGPQKETKQKEKGMLRCQARSKAAYGTAVSATEVNTSLGSSLSFPWG